MTRDDCRFCRGLAHYQRMTATPEPQPLGGMFVADLPASVAVLSADQYYRGYTIVIAKTHATELFQLSDADGDAFVGDMRRVARAVAEAFAARKMNYELLGNTVPHLHWHVVPRYDWDENPKRPIWEHEHEPRLLETAAYEEIAAAIRARLG